jgi:DNA (cytosine-5)-methyltransferase 1
VPAPDIVIGGTPCQSFSLAGARRGLADPRGALTLSYVELANAIDHVRVQAHQPQTTVVWENVPGVLSDRNNAFGHFLGALAGERRPLQPPGSTWAHAGCVDGPRRRLAWRVLDAQHFGVAQRRRRVLLVGSGRDDVDPAAILFESESLHGNPSSGVAPWQNAASVPAARTDTASGYDGLKPAYGSVTLTFGGGNSAGPIDLAACLTARTRNDFSADTFAVQSVAGAISPTLTAVNGGRGGGEDGTGKGIPIVTYAFAQNARGEVRLESSHGQLAGTLSTGGGKPGQGRPMIATGSLHERTDADEGAGLARTRPIQRRATDLDQAPIAEYEAHFLYSVSEPGSVDGWQWRVRRLMPVECERLQGLPDHYTRVPYRGHPAADTPRYRAIGNSMAVPCIAWLGRRLLSSLAPSAASRS